MHLAGEIGTYKGRGVFVSPGMTALQIMEGAWALEREFEVPPFISRAMVRAVLAAISEAEVGVEG